MIGMDLALSLLNALVFALLAAVLVVLILHPRINDGVVIKAGLISMAAGFGALALLFWDGIGPLELQGLQRALMLINAGIAVVVIGYALRSAGAGHGLRRVTDWAQLRTETMEFPTEPDND
jgi:hypothetical protein